jgi:hypothetical protein
MEENSVQKSSPITMLLCIGTVLLAPAYWFYEALASWGGPGDDIAIINILFMPILFHGMIVSWNDCFKVWHQARRYQKPCLFRNHRVTLYHKVH